METCSNAQRRQLGASFERISRRPPSRLELQRCQFINNETNQLKLKLNYLSFKNHYLKYLIQLIQLIIIINKFLLDPL